MGNDLFHSRSCMAQRPLHPSRLALSTCSMPLRSSAHWEGCREEWCQASSGKSLFSQCLLEGDIGHVVLPFLTLSHPHCGLSLVKAYEIVCQTGTSCLVPIKSPSLLRDNNMH